MKIVLHKNVKKRYKKFTKSERRQFKERRNLFLENPFHPLLYNHALHGIYAGCRSINITGNLRAIYEEIDKDTVHVIACGTHAELYE
jgi:addiction module RelE/StbE family toxin